MAHNGINYEFSTFVLQKKKFKNSSTVRIRSIRINMVKNFKGLLVPSKTRRAYMHTAFSVNKIAFKWLMLTRMTYSMILWGNKFFKLKHEGLGEKTLVCWRSTKEKSMQKSIILAPLSDFRCGLQWGQVSLKNESRCWYRTLSKVDHLF